MASKASNFVVEVRDRDFTRQGQIAAEFLDLQMVERFRAVGAWQLKLPAEHPRLNDLKQKGSGIIVTERIRREVPQAPEYSDWVETARNQLANPSFETVSGTAEVRRNFHVNPWLITTANGYYASASAARAAVPSRPDIPFAFWSDGPVVINVNRTVVARFTGLTIGTTYTATLLVLAEVAGWRFGVWDSSISTPSVPPTSRMLTANPGWREETITFTAVSTSASVGLNASAGLATSAYGITAATLVEGAVASPPFDGNSSPDPDLAAAWTGAENNSPSILTGNLAARVATTSALQARAPYLTSTTPAGGSKAARFVMLMNGAIAIPVGDFTPVNGVDYTLILKARPNHRDTLVRPRISGTSGDSVLLPVGQWTEIRLFATASTSGALSTGLYVYADNARLNGETIDIDEAMIVPGNYSGGFFGPASISSDIRRYTVVSDTTIQEERTRTDLPPLVVYDPKVYSGRMQSAVLSQDATDPKGTWLITGVDDNIIGSAVNVLPDPAHAADLQESDYWNYAGDGETVMKAAVGLNAGPYATPERSYPWLTLAANQNRGLAVSASARFDKLGTLLSSLGVKSGLGWRFAQQGNDIEFDVFEPEDKSAWIRLDIRNGGLQSTELGYSAPTATDAFVLGQGQGVERTVRVVTSPEATAEAALWGLRWEVAKDQRNTDDPTELQQAGEEILTEQGTTVHSLKVTPSDAPNQRIGIDWGLGDIVTVILDDAPAKATVTEVATSVSSAGVIRTATVGDPVGYDWEAKVANRVREHETRIGDLERLVDTGVTWDGVTGKPTEFPTRAPLAPAGQQIADWDLATDNGAYWGNDAANAPFTGMVMAQTLRDGSGRIIQEAPDPSNLLYSRARRVYSGGVWGAWKIVGPEGLPANQAASVTGTITNTGAFAAFGPTLSFTFDTPTWVRVDLAGWISAAASTDLRVGVQASGATTQAANEAYGEISWGHVLWVSNDYEQRFISKEVLCAPGTTDFRPAAYKIGSGVATVSYGMLAVAPQRRS